MIIIIVIIIIIITIIIIYPKKIGLKNPRELMSRSDILSLKKLRYVRFFSFEHIRTSMLRFT